MGWGGDKMFFYNVGCVKKLTPGMGVGYTVFNIIFSRI